MFEYNKKQKFTEKWFDGMIPVWEQIFTQAIAPIGIKDVLAVSYTHLTLPTILRV